MDSSYLTSVHDSLISVLGILIIGIILMFTAKRFPHWYTYTSKRGGDKFGSLLGTTKKPFKKTFLV